MTDETEKGVKIIKEEFAAIAGATTEFYVQLIRKGIKHEEAIDLAKVIGRAAKSDMDGHCARLGRHLPRAGT